jgi:phosphate:Na+ symporter
MVLLFASFAGTGAIPVALGIVLVLGANLGSTLIAFFDTLTEKPAGRRIPLGNVIIRSIGVLLVLPFVIHIPPLLSELSENPARMMVNFHTAFNISLAILMLPFVQIIAGLANRLMPDKAAGEDKNQPRYLDYTAFETPAAALASAERETLRMSDTVAKMLTDTLEVFRTDNPTLAHKIHNRDNRVDILHDSIKKYLARITRESLNDDESQRHLQIMTFSTNLEHIGDIIDKSLLELADKKIRNHLTFSREGFSEIHEAYSLVIDNLTLAQHIFMTGNLKMARQLFQDKMDLNKLEIQTSEKHMRRLREGVSEAHSTTSLHLDIFRDLRRIQGYLTMIAYPTLESAGELYKSRLKHNGSDETNND